MESLVIRLEEDNDLESLDPDSIIEKAAMESLLVDTKLAPEAMLEFIEYVIKCSNISVLQSAESVHALWEYCLRREVWKCKYPMLDFFKNAMHYDVVIEPLLKLCTITKGKYLKRILENWKIAKLDDFIAPGDAIYPPNGLSSWNILRMLARISGE